MRIIYIYRKINMKIYLLLLLLAVGVQSQTKAIRLEKKITAPFETVTGDTLRVGDYVQFTEGSDASAFRHIKVLNGMGEPVEWADSKAAYKKQAILFFKTENGATYAFTRDFSINLEAALLSGEITTVRLKQ
ncbi:MAG TPA: hypothetical protein VGB50_06090 [Flavobacterium sp.]|jgi:hypothetical protein